MEDITALLPHSKKEPKVDVARGRQLNEALSELMDLRGCSLCLFFEMRKQRDLYLWLSKGPSGPSVKFLISVGMARLVMTHMYGSSCDDSYARSHALLSDCTHMCTGSFLLHPLYRVTSSLSCHLFSIVSPLLYRVTSSLSCHLFSIVSPLLYRVTSSLSCHLFSIVSPLLYRVTSSLSCHLFSIVSPLLYRVTSSLSCHLFKSAFASPSIASVPTHSPILPPPLPICIPGAEGASRIYDITVERMSLVEVGPRFCLNPIRVFSGTFGGPTLNENPSYISPNKFRINEKKHGEEYREKVRERHSRETYKVVNALPVEDLAHVWDGKEDGEEDGDEDGEE
ncbi:unnamed protein product [Closterium sp. NIES-54]